MGKAVRIRRTFRTIGIAGLCLVLASCNSIPLSLIAPIALRSDGSTLEVAFCEEIFVEEIEIRQRTPEDRRQSQSMTLFLAEVNRSFRPGDRLTLTSSDVARVMIDRTDLLASDNETWVSISVRSGSDSGLYGEVNVDEAGWPADLWLPTQSDPTSTPCEFWDNWTK